MSRSGAASAIGMLIGVGVLCLVVMLAASLQVSKRAKVAEVVTDLPMPVAGSHVALDGRNARILVIHTASGAIQAFSVPLQEGKVAMPDGEWYATPVYLCEEFGLEPANPVSSSSEWSCHDAQTPEAWRQRWIWDVNGEPIEAGAVAPMRSVRVDVEGKMLKVHKWDVRP